jgi:hypothetical protein
VTPTPAQATDIVTRLLDLGLAGIVILGLAWVSWQLWLELKREREARITALTAALDAVAKHEASLNAAVTLLMQKAEGP